MHTRALETTSEEVGEGRRKVRVQVAEEALSSAIDAVYRRWANDIKIPGFRKGKVPRQLIDARVGPEAIRQEALRDALPDLYREALRAEEIEPIAPPEIEVLEFSKGRPLVFEATVDIRPEIELPDIASLSIEAPSAEVTEQDIDEQLARLRDRFAELETVSREARRGDFVLVDINGRQHDEPVEGASTPDYLYEVGSHSGPPSLDEELEGNRAGAILRFTDTMPEGAGDLAGQDVTFTILIKEVKGKSLPALDDDFAKTVGEFDSLDELRDELRERLADGKKAMVHDEIRSAALEALIDASTLQPPDRLVEQEFEHRLQHFRQDLERAGMTMAQYADQAQVTELEMRRDLRLGAARSVKAELLLEEIARRQEVDVTEDDIGREVALAAARSGRDPKEVAEQLVSSGRLGSVAADIMRRKALDYVVRTMDVAGWDADASEDGEKATGARAEQISAGEGS